MKSLRVILVVFVGLVFPAMNGLFKSTIKVVNNTDYDFKISKIYDFEGKKIVPTYDTKRAGFSDLKIEGFRCYINVVLPHWKCVREGKRQALAGTIVTKSKPVDITIKPGETVNVSKVDRDQPSGFLERKTWSGEVADPDSVPSGSDLEPGSSRVYPFQGKSFRLVGGGGHIDVSVISERLGSLSALKKAAAAAFAAGTIAALLLPAELKLGALSVGLLAAIPTAVISDQKSFLSTKHNIEGPSVDVAYEATGAATPYRGIKIILNPVKQEATQEGFQMW